MRRGEGRPDHRIACASQAVENVTCEGFGGKEDVKENRQDFLSCRNQTTFRAFSKARNVSQSGGKVRQGFCNKLRRPDHCMAWASRVCMNLRRSLCPPNREPVPQDEGGTARQQHGADEQGGFICYVHFLQGVKPSLIASSIVEGI